MTKQEFFDGAERMSAKVKEYTLEEGAHQHIFMILTRSGDYFVIPADMYDSKDAQADCLKSAIEKFDGLGFVHISEAWARTLPANIPLDKVDGRISLDPERREMLIVQAVWNDKATKDFSYEMIRDNEGKLTELKPCWLFGQVLTECGGRFVEVFQ